MNTRVKFPLKMVILSALLMSNAWAKSNGEASSQPGRNMPPPPMVDVIVAKAQTLILTENLPARLGASREAVIVPRVSGIVEKRLFNEGGFVHTGEALYQLDDDAFVAALNNAKANLQTAQARLGQAQANRDLYRSTVNRYAPLVKANAVSRQVYDEARANLKVQESNIVAARAGIAAAQAGAESAGINLGYTVVKSPIDGVIGRSEVTEGAYVVGSQTRMVKVQQLDPMYVNITQPASALMALRRDLQDGTMLSSGSTEVQIYLEDGSIYAHKGRLLFVNQTVNESTGEVTIRAEVPNPSSELLPGLYVRVAVPQSSLSGAYLIPQQAVTRGDADIVMIAEADGSYHPQPVEIVGQQGKDWVVKGGLQNGQKVIVSGMGQMAIMMGAPVVQTRLWSPNAKAMPQGEKTDKSVSEQLAQKAEKSHQFNGERKDTSLPGARDISADELEQEKD